MTRKPRRSPATDASVASTAVPTAGTALPRGRDGWLAEIAHAWADACESLPFMPLTGAVPRHSQLFHLAPLIAVKLRGLPASQTQKAIEAALCSYVATESSAPGALADPRWAFAFCYLASHVGLGLVDGLTVERQMQSFQKNPERLTGTLDRAAAWFADSARHRGRAAQR